MNVNAYIRCAGSATQLLVEGPRKQSCQDFCIRTGVIAARRRDLQSSNQTYTYLLLAGKEGMEKTMETTMVGYIGTNIWIHSFIPTKP